MARYGAGSIDPLGVPGGSAASPGALLNIELGIHGESTTLSTACASGLHALAHGFRKIRSGESEVVVAGGVECPVLPTILGLLCNSKSLSTRNDLGAGACRPFARGRDGYVLAEGAAFFVLESLERAVARDARIYAEIAGAGATSDAYSLLRLYEGGEHLAAAMKRALAEARLDPEDVAHVNAHGSSSVVSDIRETRAIKEALGSRSSRIWISAVKSMTGMALGAGGVIQAAAGMLSIHRAVAYPTINLSERDPECDLDYVSDGARERELGAALVNSTGMGGLNISVALRACTILNRELNVRTFDLGSRAGRSVSAPAR
jgi:3-oxoacyl-[acyl-carrier-protein] synthase II